MLTLTERINALPAAPCPDLTDKYMFLDTKKVVEDMSDLGFQVAGFRRPAFRTASGQFGLHEVDFRLAKDIHGRIEECPRILFTNSYDGSRKAALTSGVFRQVCTNGLVVGDVMERQKFIHVGDYADELLKQIQESSKLSQRVFERISEYREIRLDEGLYLEMARKAVKLRFTDEAVDIDPKVVLMRRRKQDLDTDLYTTWNALQENLVKGGIPGIGANGKTQMLRPLTQIEKSNTFNRGLWDLMEEYACLD